MFNKIKTWGVVGGGAVAGVLGSTLPAFATSAYTVDALALAPIQDTITGNLAVILPVGLTILAIMVGIGMIPRILYKFF